MPWIEAVSVTKAVICIRWPLFGEVNGRSARMHASSKAQSEAWGPERWPLPFVPWELGSAAPASVPATRALLGAMLGHFGGGHASTRRTRERPTKVLPKALRHLR